MGNTCKTEVIELKMITFLVDNKHFIFQTIDHGIEYLLRNHPEYLDLFKKIHLDQ